jgi:hypothetical protein
MEELFYKLYASTDAFFTGPQRRRELYLIILAGLVGVLALEFFLEFTVDSQVLLFVFSSIVQSLISLVALMGFVVVFKYQGISTREERLLEESNNETSDLARLGGNITATSSRELLVNIRPYVMDTPSGTEGFTTTRLRRIKKELESHELVRGSLNKNMLLVTIYAFSVVLINLFALSITTFLTAVPFLAVTALYLCFFLTADILRLVIRGIASSLL